MSKLIKTLPIVNAFALVLLGLSARNLPQGYWNDKVSAIIVALLISAAIPIVMAFIVERGEKSRREAAELEIDLQPHLTASLMNLVRGGTPQWEIIGIQAFRVKRIGLRKQHVRIAKMRMIPIHSSSIQWTEGKGAIGLCWATRAPQFISLDEHFRPYRDLGEVEWNALTAEQRIGLNYKDFTEVKDKYGTVAAVPMVGRTGEYLGCITADAPPGVPLPKAKVLENLTSTAALASVVLLRVK